MQGRRRDLPAGLYDGVVSVEADGEVHTLPIELGPKDEKIKILSLADTLASTIRNVFEDKSVSELFAGENQLF